MSFNYVEPVVPFSVVETAWIPMEDGVRLAAKLWLPAGTPARSVPAVIEAHPYRLRDRRPLDQAMHGYFAAHGIAAVRIDIRGSGDSEGLLLDEYLPQEQRDLAAAVEWVASQPWCDGNVGLIGLSWGGFAALQAAALRPAGLRSVIAVGSTDDRYATDVHYENGALLTLNPWWAGMMLLYNALPPDPEIAGATWRDAWRARLEANRPWIADWLRHSSRDGYWRQGSVCEDFDAIGVPVLAISGWADLYSQAVPRIVAGLPGQARGIIGPWDHAYPHLAGVGDPMGFLQLAVEWFGATLAGKQPAGVGRMAAWIPGPGGVGGTWISRSEPGDSADSIVLGAAVQSTRVDTPLGSDALAPETLRVPLGALAESLDLLGAPSVELDVTPDGEAALVVLDVIITEPAGEQRCIGTTVHNLAHRESRERPAALVPGEAYELKLPMSYCAASIPRGTVVELAIRSNDFPRVWPVRPPGSFVVRGGIRVVLPVVRGAAGESRPFAAPEMLRPTPFTWTRRPGSLAPRIEIIGERVELVQPTDSGERTLDDTGATVFVTTGETHVRAERNNAYSAEVRSDLAGEWRRGDLGIRVVARSTVTASDDAFHIRAEVTAKEGGEVVFHREWDETVPRPATL